ncbi:2-enoate reductase [Olsenella profusa DSM 13989]|uniref:FAD-dependent oxidoreductase n=1 Tax=Olsenella profusa TaxID=138595 RepID=UPI00278804C2|nr:FAD-dependent oxidoreductase [Olsenella profusa]MDP9859463.1 2-enoate reductase [Olsenella profusa DSM 13989]
MPKSLHAKLFEPITVRKTTFKNRIAFAPLGMVMMSDSRGGFSQRAQDYYVERAKGGTGLVMSGVTLGSYDEMCAFATPCAAYDPVWFAKTTWSMNERIHAFNSTMFLQVSGGFGRAMMPPMGTTFWAPSTIENRWDPSIEHRAMTTAEIDRWIKGMIAAAASARHAQFDGVEIHAVHEGYLLDQFATALYNHRTDEWGGCLENGLKPAIKVVQGIKEICGDDFPVSLRFSLKGFVKAIRQGALPGEEFEEAARDYDEGLRAAHLLKDAGYDLFNVDAGTYDSWYWNHPPMYFNQKGIYRTFGHRMKEDGIKTPIILAGRMDDPDMSVGSLGPDCDMIALGRPLLADAAWPNKVKRGQIEEIRPCLSCHAGCMARLEQGQQISCAVNPACGRERTFRLVPTTEPKKVLVVGGGVGGMEAARVAALRGHAVTLWERTDRLGGELRLSGAPDFKQDDLKLLAWYERQLRRLPITVELNHEATAAEVDASDFDVVVVGTGAKPISVDLGGPAGKTVLADEIIAGTVEPGERVAVIGGGLVGCETALSLAQHGHKVTVVEMLPKILRGGEGMCFANYDMLKDLLALNKVEVLESTSADHVEEAGLVVRKKDGSLATVEADTVMESLGYRADSALYDELQDSDKLVYNIGDSNGVGLIMDAIWDAYQLCMEI